MEKFQKNNLKKIIELLNSSTNNIIVLGAGMSVESGIPTFRGKMDFGLNMVYQKWILIKNL